MTRSDQGELNELALFAGTGGGILGGKLLGWRTVCAVERDAYAAAVLAQRQNDGLLKAFPIWSDVTTFDGRPWRGIAQIVSGGFPCQDISSAGKGAGITGERSGLWKEFARIIGEVRPRFVFVENSPMLTLRGLGVVLGDLSSMGFDAEWGVVSAGDCGAPHERQRIWIVANAKGERCWQRGGQSYIPSKDGREDGQMRAELGGTSEQSADMADSPQLQCDERNDNTGVGLESGQVPEFGNNGWAHYLADTNSTQCQRNQRAQRSEQERADTSQPSWWDVEPNVGRVADGVAARVDRLKAIGNGQVPIVAATAFRILSGAAVK